MSFGTFGKGSAGSKISELQTRLRSLGYAIDDTEVSTGQFGPSTEAAVRSFQQDHRLLVDGLVGPETWETLISAGVSLGDRLLYYTEPMLEGSDVAELQGRLNALGFDCGRADGVFGPLTHAALETLGERGRLLSGGSPTEAFPPNLGLRGARVYIDTPSGFERRTSPAIDAEIARLSSSLANALARHLDDRGAIGHQRRRVGQYLTAEERAALANATDPHVVVSLGMNWAPDPDVAGTASYYFAGSSGFSKGGRRLAALCQESLVRTLGRPDCRIHGRSWAILRRTQAPCVVVEPLTISNPEEARLARSRDIIESIAAALVSALEKYFSGEQAG